MISFEMTGLKDLDDVLDGFGDDFRKALEEELEDAAKTVLEASNKRAPRDTGALIESGSVEIRGDEVFIEYSADYALEVHERTEVPHRNGEAKFLEKAMDENQELFQEAVEKAFKRAVS